MWAVCCSCAWSLLTLSDPAWSPLPKASWRRFSQRAPWSTAEVGPRTFYVPENERNPQNNTHPEASLKVKSLYEPQNALPCCHLRSLNHTHTFTHTQSPPKLARLWSSGYNHEHRLKTQPVKKPQGKDKREKKSLLCFCSSPLESVPPHGLR